MLFVQIMIMNVQKDQKITYCLYARKRWEVRQRFKGKDYLIQPQAINRMFRNKFYIGLLTSSRYPEEIRGQHIPMVTEAIFYRVQAVLDGRNTNINVALPKRMKDNPEFPLRGVIRYTCGNPLTGAWSKGEHA